MKIVSNLESTLKRAYNYCFAIVIYVFELVIFFLWNL